MSTVRIGVRLSAAGALVAAGVAATWGPGAQLAAAALPAGCVGAPTTVTCTYTANSTFTVPSFVTSLRVEAVGGNGRTTDGGAVGGVGADLTTVLGVGPTGQVQAGQVLSITIGGNATTANFGGAHGGGAGGGPAGASSGGGGGSTELDSPIAGPDQRMVVAGGGGGGGRGSSGAGGDATTGLGHDGTTAATDGSGNSGGVGGLSGGDGGTGGAGGTPGPGSGSASGSKGIDGSGGSGGAGATTGLGGGGGAGYFGGGGGGGGSVSAGNTADGGGGGAGSSFALGTGGSIGASNGTPRMVIGYDKAIPTVTSTTSAASGAVGLAIQDAVGLSGGAAPTGSVTVKLFPYTPGAPGPQCTGSPTFSSTVSVAGDGIYPGPSTTPAEGTYTWVATYGGDIQNTAAASACGAAGSITTVTAAAVATPTPSGGAGSTDKTPPVPTLVAAGAPTQLTPTFTVSWTATDAGTGNGPASGVASYDVSYLGVGWNTPPGLPVPWQSATTATSAPFTGIPGSEYCFSVRARDNAGNVSANTQTSHCVTLPLDDRSLKASSGWKRVKASSCYLGTATVATTKGATLTRTGTLGGRVALVVETGPGDGSVVVSYTTGKGKKAKTAYLHTVELRTKKPKTRVVIPLPKLTKTTTITIRTTSAKRVRIDGLLLARY